MARPSIDQLRGLPDYQSVWRWNLVFATIPAAVTAASGVPTSDDMNIRCESAAPPTATVQTYETNVRGQRVRNPGILQYNGTIDLVFNETVDNKIRSLIRAWREAIWASKTGVSAASISSLKGVMNLNQLDNTDKEVWQYSVIGVFIENHTLPVLDGSTSDAWKPTITVSYDYYTDQALT
jgi:hypothetical protein